MTDPNRDPLMHIFAPGLDDDRCSTCAQPMQRHVLLSEFDDWLDELEDELRLATEGGR